MFQTGCMQTPNLNFLDTIHIFCNQPKEIQLKKANSQLFVSQEDKGYCKVFIFDYTSFEAKLECFSFDFIGRLTNGKLE